jgi:hypothetical protein
MSKRRLGIARSTTPLLRRGNRERPGRRSRLIRVSLDEIADEVARLQPADRREPAPPSSGHHLIDDSTPSPSGSGVASWSRTKRATRAIASLRCWLGAHQSVCTKRAVGQPPQLACIACLS